MKKQNTKGFTLLELLVVIGIIAILISILAVSYTTAQQRGRDSKRRNDIKTVQAALEQFYAASATYSYPTTGNCNAASAYVKGNWPTDPIGSAPYTYNLVCPAAGTSYCLCARLEAGAGSGNSSTNTCTWATGATAVYYCTGNLQ